MDSADLGKLFWTVCYLYLSNGAEEMNLIDHLCSITGDVVVYYIELEIVQNKDPILSGNVGETAIY